MLRIIAVALVGFAIGAFADAEEFDAIITDASRAFTRQKNPAEKLVFGKITLDSRGKIVSTIYKEGLLSKDTKIVMGIRDDKTGKWLSGEPVAGGINADIFKEAGTIVQLRVTVNDDQNTISQILVKKDSAPLQQAEGEFDAILKQIGRQTNGRGGIMYNRLDLDDKGRIIKTFALTSGLVTKETKVAMGKFNEKTQSWEAGEEIASGLYGDIFRDLGAKTVFVRITFRDDRRGISQILVTQIGEKGKR